MSRTTTQPEQQVDPQIIALVTAQAAVRTRLTRQAVGMARASAAGFTGWYDTDAITAWSAGLAVQIEALQRAMAQTTDAYLARILTLLTGKRVSPVGRIQVGDLRADGTTHAGAYARAADVYRWQQSQFDRTARDLLTESAPEPFTLINPDAAAIDRVGSVADIDAQMADRAQTEAVYTEAASKGLITGYRRVIHPENSKGGTCGLCVAASDRLYSAHEPKPIHSRCECTTLPVLEGADPGSALNAIDLRRLYRDAGGTHRSKLKATRYQVDEHGELGLLLNPKGAKVRTARQAARDANKAPRRPKTDAQRAADLQRVYASLTEALPKARDLAQSDPRTWNDYLAKLEARVADLQSQLAA